MSHICYAIEVGEDKRQCPLDGATAYTAHLHLIFNFFYVQS